jgi:hypothetical protein
MSQVGVAKPGSHLDPVKPMGVIGKLADELKGDRSYKAGPAGPGIELIQGGEKGLSAYDIHIDSGLMMVPVSVPKRGFCPPEAGDNKLLRLEAPFQLLKGGFGESSLQ